MLCMYLLYKNINIVGAAIYLGMLFLLHVCKTYPFVDMLNGEKENQNGEVLIVQSINKLES